MVATAEELLAGVSLTHGVELPPEYRGAESANGRVVLRPLTVRDLQRISKAAENDETRSAALMIQQALIEPSLKREQVDQLPAGLARFLVDKINEISGISTARDDLEELVQQPLARACFILAKEFGWTPEEVSGMTIGQILLYLEMAHRTGNTV